MKAQMFLSQVSTDPCFSSWLFWLVHLLSKQLIALIDDQLSSSCTLRQGALRLYHADIDT